MLIKKKSKLTCVISITMCTIFLLTSCGRNNASSKTATEENLQTSLSHAGYVLDQVIVLSRHNIRSPLSSPGSVLDTITPNKWFEWTSGTSELSTRGGILETEMGQYFRKWLESEELIPENYHPTTDEVRIYANSKQRTIATAQYFSAGMLPTANMAVEYHEDFDKMDPVFNPQLTFCNSDYAKGAEEQITDMYSDTIAELSDNYDLLLKTLDFEKSEGFKNGEIAALDTSDSIFTFEEGAEPSVSGSLKTACSASDALILQYYEESDAKKAAFNHNLTLKQWEDIAEIKDIYGDVLFTAPLIAVNVANPLLQEIRSEMNTDGRKFTFLCGHDSNIGSVLAALEAKDYSLPETIEKKTPIGSKLVLSKWYNPSGDIFWSADIVYQKTEQLRNISILSLDEPPAIYHINFSNIEPNVDGLYSNSDLQKLFDDKIAEYDALFDKYISKAA